MLFILALAAVVGIIACATYLTIGVTAFYLGTSRFVAGLFLGLLFARLPRVYRGKLQTIGVIPKAARPWVMMSLLVLCSLHFLVRGEAVYMACLALAAALPLAFRWMKRKAAKRMSTFLFSRSPNGPARPMPADDTVIDAEFLEKKD